MGREGGRRYVSGWPCVIIITLHLKVDSSFDAVIFGEPSLLGGEYFR